MSKKNELPQGYNSWLGFWFMNKDSLQKSWYADDEYHFGLKNPSPISVLNRMEDAVTIEFDYAKARAFEELMKNMPSLNELDIAFHNLVPVFYKEEKQAVLDFLRNLIVAMK